MSKRSSGFTLLELIVVLAGLGILSSLAIPNYIKYIDYARVDEAKSLLNNVAADCLRNLREDDDALTKEVDPNIISMSRLENTGYSFQVEENPTTEQDYLPKCGNVFITATKPIDRDERLPDLGFIIGDGEDNKGKLTKIAVNSGSDTEFAAKSWAGSNTTDSDALKKWQELNTTILEAQQSCKEARDDFRENVGTGPTKMWDSSATEKCSPKPPIDESNLDQCTASGCNKDVWYIDGEICGFTSDEFEQCRIAKLNRECQEDRNNKRDENATTNSIDGDTLPRCGSERFWFFEGDDVGSAQEWSNRKCDKNKKDLLSTTHSGPVEYCEVSPIYIIGGEEIFPDGSREDAKAEFDKRLADNKDAQCTQALNNDAVNRRNGGPYTSPTPSGMSEPVGQDCGETYWYCKGKIHREPGSKEKYDNDENCKNVPPPKPKPWWCPYSPSAPQCR